MTFLFVTDGTWGDTLPFMFAARHLASLGHTCTVFSNEYYAEYARDHGIDFIATTSQQQRKDFLNNPDLWHPTKGMSIIGSYAATMFHTTLPIIDTYVQKLRTRPDEVHIVAHSFSYSAKTIAQKYSFRYSSLLISPIQLRSSYRLPMMYGGKDINHAPHFIKKLTYPIVDKFMLDTHFDASINTARTAWGLKPIHSFVHWATFEYQSVALWPEWYAKLYPDQSLAHCAGFPTTVEFESKHSNTPEQDLMSWITSEPSNKPILVTMGSGYAYADELIASLDHVTRSHGRRFIFVGPNYTPRSAHKYSSKLFIAHHVTFSSILPHCSAIIHHGGAGTLAQAITHGLPHIVVPMSHDQPDNASHIERNNLGTIIWNRTPSPEELKKAIDLVLSSKDILESTKNTRRRVVASEDGIRRACDILLNHYPAEQIRH